MAEALQDPGELLKGLSCTPSDDELVKVYVLYKQAGVGNVNLDPPDRIFEQVVAELIRMRDTPQSEAREKYINLVEELKLKDCKP